MNQWWLGLIPLGLAVGWWFFKREKREDYQRERIDLAVKLANAKTPEEHAAITDLIEDLERRRAAEKETP